MDDLLKYWLLLVVKAIVFICDAIVDMLFGYSFVGGIKEERAKGADNYESSAHLVKIIWKVRPHIFKQTVQLDNFLYKHEAYLHPNFVLKNKNVTMFILDKEHAAFCVTDPDVDVYDTKTFPFMTAGQWKVVEKLLIMPIASFHRLADEVGRPKVPVITAGMTARSGSTLLVQIFNKVPKTRVISESFSTKYTHEMRAEGKITAEESRRMLRSTMILKCKIEPGSDVERIFIKLTGTNAPQLADIRDLFPDFIYLFCTRHPMQSITSITKVFSVIFTTGLFNKLGFNWREMVASNFGFAYGNKHDKVLRHFSKWRRESYAECGLIFYAGSIAGYFENKDMFRKVVLYEDLSSNPKEEVGKIFNVSGVSQEHVPLALEALKNHSQKAAVPIFASKEKTTLDEDLIKKFGEYMSDLGMTQLKIDMPAEEFKQLFK